MSPWGRCSDKDKQLCCEKLSFFLPVPLSSVPQRSPQTLHLPVVAMVVGVAGIMVTAASATVVQYTTAAIAAGVGIAGAGFGSAEPTPFGMLLHFSANKIIVAVVVLVYVIGSLIALSASMQ